MSKIVSFTRIIAITSLIFTAACTKTSEEDLNTFNVALVGNVKGLDPAHMNDQYTNDVGAHIYETLYSYHYLKRPLTLEPMLAEALPEVSKDGLTHTIKIKKGVRYTDDKCFATTQGKGREVTAEDFIYAWKRLADTSNASEGWWIFDGKIKGLNEWREKLGKKEVDYTTAVEGLKATDSHTLVLTLTEPYYQLHHVLTMNYSAPLPKECVDQYGQEFLNNPIGTGPFKLESWTRNSKITLAKNPNFRGENYPSEGEAGDEAKGLLKDAGKPIPFVEKVVFHEIIEDQPRWLNFMKGNLEISAIPKDSYDSAVSNNQLKPELTTKGISLQISEDPDVTYTYFNMEDPILGKYRFVRQAMSMAYDHVTTLEKFYNNRAIAAQSPIPPTIDGYDPNFKNPYREFNIEKAKELLAKAGFPEGKGLPEFTYDTTSSATARQMAEHFQQMMAAIGVKIAIKVSTWPEFTKKQKEKKSQMGGIAWMADYPDAQNFLQLFYGPNVAPGPNNALYKNKRFDELYVKAKLTPPSPERTKIYQEMRDIVVEDTPWIMGVHRLRYRVLHSWVHNSKISPMNLGTGKYIRIDTKAKAEGKKKL